MGHLLHCKHEMSCNKSRSVDPRGSSRPSLTRAGVFRTRKPREFSCGSCWEAAREVQGDGRATSWAGTGISSCTLPGAGDSPLRRTATPRHRSPPSSASRSTSNTPSIEIETLGFDFCHPVRTRPRDVRQRPVGSAARPYACALERGGDLNHVSVSDAQFHLAGVRDHFNHVSVAALIHRLRHERLEPGADLARGQVSRSRDELDPEGHASLPPVA